MNSEKTKAYRAEWARNYRRNRTPEVAEAERAREREYRKSRNTIPEVLNAKRENVRKACARYRSRMSPEKAEQVNAKKRELMRKYFAKPEVKEARKRYRATPEVAAAHVRHTREYHKKYPEKRLAVCHKRRARLLGGGSYTEQEWFALVEQYGHRCLCCKKPEPEIKLTVDHIVPIAKGGTNDIGNIQPLCAKCNFRKQTKTIDYRTPTEA